MGTARIHAVTHVTFADSDSDGVPDPGEVTSQVDRFSVTCG